MSSQLTTMKWVVDNLEVGGLISLSRPLPLSKRTWYRRVWWKLTFKQWPIDYYKATILSKDSPTQVTIEEVK